MEKATSWPDKGALVQADKSRRLTSLTMEPSHEIMVLFILCKLILQTPMCSHAVGLDVWFLVRPFIYFQTSCVRTVKALARLRRLTWAFAGHLCDKYHNLMSWLNHLHRVNKLIMADNICETLKGWYLYILLPWNKSHCSRSTKSKSWSKSYVPRSPKLPLFSYSPNFQTFVPLFPWNKCPCSPLAQPWEGLICVHTMLLCYNVKYKLL